MAREGTDGARPRASGPPVGITLRWSTPADAAEGAALHRACWRESYGPIVDRGLLEAQLADPVSWRERWARTGPDQFPAMLAEVDAGPPDAPGEAPDAGALVGFAVAGPGRREGDAETELYALYVRRAWHGTGLGRALFDAVVEPGPCSVWVLEDNARARSFYGTCGLTELTGRQRFDPLDAWEVRLHRS